MNRSEFHCVLRYGSVWDASLHGSSADDVSIASLHGERHTAMRLSHSNHEACQLVGISRRDIQSYLQHFGSIDVILSSVDHRDY